MMEPNEVVYVLCMYSTCIRSQSRLNKSRMVLLAGDVVGVGGPAARHNEVAALIESGEIMRHLGAEEAGIVQRRPSTQHAYALGFTCLTTLPGPRKLGSRPSRFFISCVDHSKIGQGPSAGYTAWITATKQTTNALTRFSISTLTNRTNNKSSKVISYPKSGWCLRGDPA